MIFCSVSKPSIMECHVVSTAVRTLFTRFKVENRVPANVVGFGLGSGKVFQNWVKLNHYSSIRTNPMYWKLHCTPPSLLQKFSNDDDHSDLKDLSDEEPRKPLSSDELKALLLDSERLKLIKKLCDANQHNRLLKRQLQDKEDALLNFKSELAVLHSEIQTLVSLAEEISKYSIPEGSRKINGRYIQSRLFSRLEAVQEKLEEQIKDVDVAQSKEVPLIWYGVAENVHVMGSFDGWSQGEDLSQEYTGYQTKFSTTLMLRPGRYEIKFLVDGEWQLSPELPTVGEGLMQNNLLVVE